MFRAENLSKSFGDRVVLKQINFKIDEGKIAVVLGGSGCGKTTLLRIMMGSSYPNSGELWINGRRFSEMTEADFDAYKKRIGVLFQGGALLNSLTVGENVALPIVEHAFLDKAIVDIMVKMKLDLVGLRDAEHLMPSQLSGGMKKRISLARAIALDPEIVFYDEPSSGLDPITAAVIDQLMIDLNRKLRITSVVVTHDIRSAFNIADQIIMLHNGAVIFDGTVAEIRKSENPYIRQFVEGKPEGAVPLRVSLKDLIGD